MSGESGAREPWREGLELQFRVVFYKFQIIRSSWSTLQNLVGLVKTDYTTEDLSYEVVLPLEKREDISN